MLLYENKDFVEKIKIRKNMLKDLTVSLRKSGIYIKRKMVLKCYLAVIILCDVVFYHINDYIFSYIYISV